jgi:serine/threonine-protein kinase
MLKRRLNELPPHPSRVKNDLPPELDAIVVKMLAVRPDDRFQTAAELRAALDEIRLAPEPGSGLTTSGATAIPRPSLDPSKAPTVESPVAGPLPAWMPSWMASTSARRTARTALTVAGVALAGGAAVGAALTVAMREDGATPRDSVATRPNVAAPSGQPRTGVPTGATTAPVGAVVAKTTPASGTTPGVAGTPRETAPRAAQTPTQRGSTNAVPPRARAEDAAGERLVAERRAPPVSPEYSNAMIPINAFARAVQSGDVERIRQVYPGLTAAEQKSWERVFKESKVKASVQSTQGLSINQAAGTAVVQFVLQLSFNNPTTGSETSAAKYRYVARLKRQAQTLRIEKLELRQ